MVRFIDPTCKLTAKQTGEKASRWQIDIAKVLHSYVVTIKVVVFIKVGLSESNMLLLKLIWNHLGFFNIIQFAHCKI